MSGVEVLLNEMEMRKRPKERKVNYVIRSDNSLRS